MVDQSLPTIDYRSVHAPQAIAHSLQDSGFAILSHSPIDHPLIERTYRDWLAFFLSEDKVQYRFDPKVQAGYFPLQTETAKGYTTPDLKEFFHIYEGHSLPQGMSQATWDLFNQLRHLATELLEWIEAQAPPHIHANFTEPLDAMIADSKETLFRLLHYPPLPDTIPTRSCSGGGPRRYQFNYAIACSDGNGLRVIGF